jgi:hypothetical protein
MPRTASQFVVPFLCCFLSVAKSFCKGVARCRVATRYSKCGYTIATTGEKVK